MISGVIAAEGMWPLDNLPASRLQAEYTFTPSRNWGGPLDARVGSHRWGAFWFDARTNRAVAVHSGAILESLTKVYGATDLVREIMGQ